MQFAAPSKPQTSTGIAGPDPERAPDWTSPLPGGVHAVLDRAYSGQAWQKQHLLRSVLPESCTAAIEMPRNRAPYANGVDVRLSLAHTGTTLIAAGLDIGSTGEGWLGVDIETTRQRDSARLEAFLGWPTRSIDLAHFYRRWTLAEALLKTGWQDATSDMRAVFSALDHHALTGRPVSDKLFGARVTLQWPEVGPGLCAAVVCIRPGTR